MTQGQYEKKQATERNHALYQDRQDGLDGPTLAQKYNLSISRVWIIIKQVERERQFAEMRAEMTT